MMTVPKGLTGVELIDFHNIIRDSTERGLKASAVQTQLETRFGRKFSRRAVQVYLKATRGLMADPSATASTDALRIEGTGSDTQELELNADRVVTLEDALRKAGTDLTRWDVERWVVNSWEVGAKGPDGRIRVTPLWQVKVWLKAKMGWSPSEFRKLLVEDLRALAPSYHVSAPSASYPFLAELSIFDAHFGKLAWAPETGQDYDTKICQARYLAAARDLLTQVAEKKPERILYVVGNDFFHADHKGFTTSGTLLDCDGRWQKAFRIGTKVCVTVAEEAAQVAPVDILVVPGNHDREKAFCLGEVLSARFHNHPTITVTNNPGLYSYYRWGKVLLGFVHGDAFTSDAKRVLLPQTMATDRPMDWSQTVWREWHLGHFHSEREDVWKYRTASTVRDVTVRILPSLSSTDAWHRENNYASVLAAEAHVYHKEFGRRAYFVHQVQP